MKLYQVTTLIKKDEKQLQKMDSFYVASNINNVIKELEGMDKVIGLNEIAPITKMLD